jgi:hypothetical protein
MRATLNDTGFVADDSRRPSNRVSAIEQAALVIFLGSCMLLPLERGFTNLKILGVLLPSSWLIVLGAIMATFLVARRSQAVMKSDLFMRLQIGLFVGLLASAFYSPVSESFRTSVRLSIQYLSIWIGGFYVIRVFVREHGVHSVARSACIVGCFAAAVGVIEFVVNMPVGPYRMWAEDYLTQRMLEQAIIEDGGDIRARAGGTLGNPIIYSTLMSGILLVALKYVKGWLCWVTVWVSLLSCLLTFSRTSLLMLALIAAGYLTSIPLKSRIISVGVILGAGFLSFFTLGVVRPELMEDAIDLWSQRLGFAVGIAAEGAREGVDSRMFLVGHAIDRIASGPVENWIYGNGAQSGMALSQDSISGLATLDNSYITFLYENGLIGFGLFLGAFSIPLRLAFRRKDYFVVIGLLTYLSTGLSYVFHFYLTANIPFMIFIAAALDQDTEVRPGIRSDSKSGS